VLQNLLVNALRYAHNRINLRLWQERKMACVEVADDGDGIDAEHLPYSFNRFFRVNPIMSREEKDAG
jgi:signal transduction histidine kinase